MTCDKAISQVIHLIMRAEVKTKIKIGIGIFFALSALSSTITSPILYGKQMEVKTPPEHTTSQPDTLSTPIYTGAMLEETTSSLNHSATTTTTTDRENTTQAITTSSDSVEIIQTTKLTSSTSTQNVIENTTMSTISQDKTTFESQTYPYQNETENITTDKAKTTTQSEEVICGTCGVAIYDDRCFNTNTDPYRGVGCNFCGIQNCRHCYGGQQGTKPPYEDPYEYCSEIIDSLKTTTTQDNQISVDLTTQSIQTTSHDEFCSPVFFIRQNEQGLQYADIKDRCAEKALEINADSGFPAFFRNEDEYKLYKQSGQMRIEYLGYEMRGNSVDSPWFNADGSESSWFNWDVFQPDQADEKCAQTRSYAHLPSRKWHDVRCICQADDEWCNGAFYTCRFEISCSETTTTATTTTKSTTTPTTATPTTTATIPTTTKDPTIHRLNHNGNEIKEILTWTRSEHLLVFADNGEDMRFVVDNRHDNGDEQGWFETIKDPKRRWIKHDSDIIALDSGDGEMWRIVPRPNNPNQYKIFWDKDGRYAGNIWDRRAVTVGQQLPDGNGKKYVSVKVTPCGECKGWNDKKYIWTFS